MLPISTAAFTVGDVGHVRSCLSTAVFCAFTYHDYACAVLRTASKEFTALFLSMASAGIDKKLPIIVRRLENVLCY